LVTSPIAASFLLMKNGKGIPVASGLFCYWPQAVALLEAFIIWALTPLPFRNSAGDLHYHASAQTSTISCCYFIVLSDSDGFRLWVRLEAASGGPSRIRDSRNRYGLMVSSTMKLLMNIPHNDPVNSD
jgi:hypothetical protein